MSKTFTRAFTASIAPRGAIDPRYELRSPTWHVVYEKDGEVVFEAITCRPDQALKDTLAERGVNIMEALVEFVG